MFQNRQISFDHIPHQLHIDPEIIVNQFVSHPSDGFPPYGRMSFFQRDGYALDRLPDNFEVPYDRVLGLSVGKEALLSCRCIAYDVLNGVSNVQEIDAVVLHRGTASAWIRCSRYGLRP